MRRITGRIGGQRVAMGRSGPMAAVLGCAILSAGLPAAAQEAAGLEDFTFRRVKVSDMAAGKRITVQIDPVEQARRLAATAWKDPALQTAEEPAPAEGAPMGAAPAPASSYAWFWDKVPAGIGNAQDRFEQAMASLSQGPGGATVRAPRMQSMQTLADVYGRDILIATLDTDVSPALVLAVMGIESAGRSDAVSTKGAVGLMQLIPATAERFNVRNPYDPGQNIRGGMAYLRWLLAYFEGDVALVAAAYNAGEGTVERYRGVPPYLETRAYVRRILALAGIASHPYDASVTAPSPRLRQIRDPARL